MQSLLGHLQRNGFTVDVARDLAAARRMFFGSGGHRFVLVGPDVAPGLAGAIVHSLRAVDPELPAITFGPAVDRGTPSTRTTTVGFHPGSRAGAGALLRFLHDLPEAPETQRE